MRKPRQKREKVREYEDRPGASRIRANVYLYISNLQIDKTKVAVPNYQAGRVDTNGVSKKLQ